MMRKVLLSEQCTCESDAMGDTVMEMPVAAFRAKFAESR